MSARLRTTAAMIALTLAASTLPRPPPPGLAVAAAALALLFARRTIRVKRPALARAPRWPRE